MAKKKNDENAVREALIEQPVRKKPVYLPFGCTLLDLLVGGGEGMGIPIGTMFNIIGDTSGGKSFIKNEFMAASYHHCANKGTKLKFFSDDSESGDTFDTERLYGVELRPDDRMIGKTKAGDSRTVEGMDAQVSLFLDSLEDDEIGIYAIDSLDGLADANKEKASDERQRLLVAEKEVVDKNTYDMSKQKFLSTQFFPTQANKVEDKNAIVVIVSQVREKIGAMMFEEKVKPTCDGSLKFYCHTRIFVKRVCPIKKTVTVDGQEKEIVVGFVAEVSSRKSKTPRPYRTCRISAYFDYGIDEIGSNIDYLFDLRNDLGQLTPSLCKLIPWDMKKEQTKENCEQWLKDKDLLTNYQNFRKNEDGKKTFAMKIFLDWVGSNENISAKFAEEFGTSLSRDELISLAENDPMVRKTLRSKVIAKWEAFEEAARTNRPSKYSLE